MGFCGTLFPLSLSSQSSPKKRLTPDEARQIQLDIIYTLHKHGAPTKWELDPGLGDVFHQPPLHPSLMALGYECSFSEAAILIGECLLVVIVTTVVGHNANCSFVL